MIRKVGLILECGPDGPDKQVYEYLIAEIGIGRVYSRRTGSLTTR